MTYDEVRALCDGDTSTPQEQMEAAWLIMKLWRLCEVWDNAHDQDKPSSPVWVDEAFEYALFGLHENVVWRKHKAALQPALKLAIINWKTANELEATGELEKLHTAFVLRCSPFDFFTTVVQCVAPENAAEAALAFRSDTKDTLESYLHEHLKE